MSEMNLVIDLTDIGTLISLLDSNFFSRTCGTLIDRGRQLYVLRDGSLMYMAEEESNYKKKFYFSIC